MQITDVRVRKVAKEGKLKAVVSITIDEEFVVHDIKVIEGEKGLFIAMPSKKAMDGEYRDIAHPINSGTRERIQSTILGKYTIKSWRGKLQADIGGSRDRDNILTKHISWIKIIDNSKKIFMAMKGIST